MFFGDIISVISQPNLTLYTRVHNCRKHFTFGITHYM